MHSLSTQLLQNNPSESEATIATCALASAHVYGNLPQARTLLESYALNPKNPGEKMTNSELASLVYLRDALLFKRDFPAFMIANDSLAARCAESDFGIVALLAKATVLHHIFQDTPSALAIVTSLFEQEPDSVDVSSAFWAIAREDTIISVPKRTMQRGKNIPSTLQLDQNYPNPFRSSTTFKFAIPNDGHVLLNVFNVLGQKIATLIDQGLSAGEYTKNFSMGNQPSGLYFYQIINAGDVRIRKMNFMR